MADSSIKPKINAEVGKIPLLKKAELDFMKVIEEKNLERVKKLERTAVKNKWTASALGVSVFGIYLYSMYAVRQETFLDDFNEPAKVQQ